MKTEKKKDLFPLVFCLIFTFVFLSAYWPGLLGMSVRGVFAHTEDVWVDLLFRWRAADLPAADPRIILAAVDEETGKKYGFPLPRVVYAQLLDKLKGYGVKAVTFDVLFFEKREGDAELDAATRRFGNVVHIYRFDEKIVDVPGHEAMQVIEMHEPVPQLKKAARLLGYASVQNVLDPDGHLRKTQLFDLRIQDPRDMNQMGANMDAASVTALMGIPLAELQARYADPRPRPRFLQFRRPVEWLRHEKRDEKEKQEGKTANLATVTSAYRTISALDLLDGQLSSAQRAALRGSLVLIGSTAVGYYDHYPNPFDPTAPGMEFHANSIDNVVHEDFLNATPRLAMLCVLLAMIWLPLLLLRFPPVTSNGAVAGFLVFWFVFTYWTFCRGTRTEFVAPAVALVLSFLVLTVRRVLTEGAEKKFIKQTFGQFVSPDVVDKLVADPSQIKLGGEKREMTVLFLDIAHFTTISEKMKPEALIQFLNKYLSALSQVIHEHKGTVDKYIGDCIMAFWNAPLDDGDHRLNACLAAVECQQKMSELNKDLDPTLPEVPAIRIGLNAGEMTVGLTGSEKKLAYTVIGDEVNLGSRLEGANKFFGSHIMVSEAVYSGAKDAVAARELGRVRVVGKDIPIRVFELLARQGELSAQWQQALPLYEAGLKQFHAREFEQAAVSFEGVLKLFPKDGPSFFYCNAARDYAAIPPDQDWDGVIKLTAK
ncbi:MAG: adenylate/guanylate cyclase domain-containing protein [Elusimicrobia bacterium]|nr:adenylate/guanylate cyclase domain-containing protein [Elusimicrobiota bacterium]